jgi:hypothetical protein
MTTGAETLSEISLAEDKLWDKASLARATVTALVAQWAWHWARAMALPSDQQTAPDTAGQLAWHWARAMALPLDQKTSWEILWDEQKLSGKASLAWAKVTALVAQLAWHWA